MEQTAIATAYDDAARIITTARQQNVNIDAVWQKLNRVAKYISTAASAQLSETLN